MTGALSGNNKTYMTTGLGMGANGPGVVSAAMGAATTFGRRTSSIMSLNVAGKGGLPRHCPFEHFGRRFTALVAMVTLARIIGAVAALTLYGIIGRSLNSLLITEGSTLSMVLMYLEFLVFMTIGALVGEHTLRWLTRNRSE